MNTMQMNKVLPPDGSTQVSGGIHFLWTRAGGWDGATMGWYPVCADVSDEGLPIDDHRAYPVFVRKYQGLGFRWEVGAITYADQAKALAAAVRNKRRDVEQARALIAQYEDSVQASSPPSTFGPDEAEEEFGEDM